jgi:hypothetical protein
VLDEFACSADILELTEPDLGDDSSKLATSGGDSVSGGTITSGEDFSREMNVVVLGPKLKKKLPKQ